MPCYHDCLFDILMTKQSSFQVSNLDPIASNLDTKVFASLVDQTAVREHKSEITGQIETPITAFRIAFEFGLRKIAPPPVARRQITTPHGYLADLIEPNLLTRIIQQ